MQGNPRRFPSSMQPIARGDVSVDVEYSTLNWGRTGDNGQLPGGPFPMVPGIDLAGVVTSSSHSDWGGR